MLDVFLSYLRPIIKDSGNGHFIKHFFRVHYPGATAPAQAIQSNETLWASEDYSTFNDEVGAGCWARVSDAFHKLLSLSN